AGADGEFNVGADAVGHFVFSGEGPGGLGENAERRRIEEKTKVVEEVASFADDPTAAFGKVREPMLWIEFAGVDAIGNGFGTGNVGEMFFDFGAGGGEAAVEADLNCGG